MKLQDRRAARNNLCLEYKQTTLSTIVQYFITILLSFNQHKLLDVECPYQ